MGRDLCFVTLVILVINCKLQSTICDDSLNASLNQLEGYGTEWIYFPNDNGTPEVVSLQTPHRSLLPSLDEVGKLLTFTLYTREHDPCVFSSDPDESCPQIDFGKDTKIITHGYNSSGSEIMCQSIKYAYLANQDVNAIVLDWGAVSGNPMYLVSAANTRSVGYHYAKFIDGLIERGANASRIHLVGHSLGAQASGYAGRGVTKGKIGRISGLDPALPGFLLGVILTPLGSKDAQFVDVIHTCGGVLGILHSIGHVDFYPNGGTPPQTGCDGPIEFIVGCSHAKGWLYFLESIDSRHKFVAKKCSSWHTYKANACANERALMGEPASSNSKGNYYLRTNPFPPFAELVVTTIKKPKHY